MCRMPSSEKNAPSHIGVQEHIVSNTPHQTGVHDQQAFPLEIKRRSEANLAHDRRVSSDGASKTETQSAGGVFYRIVNRLLNDAIRYERKVLEFFLHEQRQDQRLTRFCQAFLDGVGAWNGKLNLRVERNIHTFVPVVIKVELKAELGSPNADSHGFARRLRARQREFKFHLGRELMTKNLRHNSIIRIDEKKIKCPQFL